LTLKLEEVTKLYFIDEPLYYYRILRNSQTRGYRNEMKNKTKTALARLEAYQRRYGFSDKHTSRARISRTLFLGAMCAIANYEFYDFYKLIKNLFKINPFFMLDLDFYRELFARGWKIIKIKRQQFKKISR
jgi:hypothetical protein